MSEKTVLRIGTRGSQLARWQAKWTQDRLAELGEASEIVIIHTSGDRQQTGAIANIGATGVFTKEIQNALLEDRIDIAVHSMKDLPTETVPGLILAAVPVREDPRDCFVSHKALSPEELPEGAKIGSGSMRRRCQLLNRYGEKYQILDIRGNVETRLAKLDSGQYDAVILAVAGLTRLGLCERIRPEAILPPEDFLPAVGQGALALEIHESNTKAFHVVERLNLFPRFAEAIAERNMLSTLEGGCIAPIGAYSRWEGDRLFLHGRLLSQDGRFCYDAAHSAEISSNSIRPAEELGRTVALDLLKQSVKTNENSSI